jgi:flagellin
MASDVTLSKGVRQNLLSLQSTAELLNRTQERLSSGKKVNSALDNPINFFTSSGLSSRANDLSRLLDSVGNAVQTLAAADKGISAITKLIETAGATARQALTAAEGTTTYSVNQTGNIAITDDVAATGNSGGTTIAADVAARTGTSFAGATLVAEAEANIVIDVSDIAADFDDGEQLTISIDGTDYTFVRDDAAAGVDGVPADTYYFDGDAGVSTEDQLAQKLTAILTTADDVATVVYDNVGDTITITAANNAAGEDFTVNLGTTGFAGPDVVNTGYVAPSTITVDDGTNTETFTYVTGGGVAANGTFSDLTELVAAINDGASSVAANLTATGPGGALRLLADNATATIEVTSTGTIAADIGFTTTYTAANSGYNAALEALSGQTLDIEVGATEFNLVFGTGGGQIATRAALDTALGAIGSINVGNQLVLTAANNTDSISVSGTAAAALGFGGANDEFDPTNAQIAGFTGQLTIQVGSGGAQTIEFDNAATGEILNRSQLEDRLTAINSTLTGVTLSVDATSDFLSIVSTSSESITVGGSAAASFGVGATTYSPTETFTANATRTSLQTDFNNLLTQITELAGDASFNGINLLDGDNLTVTFNEDGSSTLGISGVTFSAAGLGLTSVTGAGFQENTNVDAAIAQLDTATAALRSQASKFGSNLSIVQTRQDFTKNMISVLQIGADNLVLADTNEEGANMLALNTRQQLSTTALSLAAQADQNVLRLF